MSTRKGIFPNLRYMHMDPQLALQGSVCNITIIFTCESEPHRAPRTAPMARQLTGEVTGTQPKGWDDAPAVLALPYEGEGALVNLWRKLHRHYRNWRSLTMECTTDTTPTYSLFLKVPASMEGLSLTVHELGARITVDLSHALGLQRLRLSGAFNLFPGDIILTNLTELDVSGNKGTGTVLITSITPEFLFAILKSAPNVQDVKTSLVNQAYLVNQTARHQAVSLPHLRSLELSFTACDTGTVTAVTDAIIASPKLTALDLKLCNPPSGGDIDIVTMIRRSGTTLTRFSISATPDDNEFDIPAVMDVLRICPQLETLLLSANLLTPALRSAFASVCPVVTTVMLVGRPTCSPQELSEMLGTHRDSLFTVVCPAMASEEVAGHLGASITVEPFDEEHDIIQFFDEEE